MRALRSLVVAVAVAVIAGIFQDATAQSNRMTNKLGIHVGLLGDPYPTLVGFNANYNVMDFLRASAGYGSVSADVSGGKLTATTIGFGVRGMVPDWNFTPVVGVSWATISVSASASGISGDVAGFSGSASHLYATFGIDWQTGMGFNLGAGYNMSFKSGVPGVPYLNLGWYFAI